MYFYWTNRHKDDYCLGLQCKWLGVQNSLFSLLKLSLFAPNHVYLEQLGDKIELSLLYISRSKTTLYVCQFENSMNWNW